MTGRERQHIHPYLEQFKRKALNLGIVEHFLVHAEPAAQIGLTRTPERPYSPNNCCTGCWVPTDVRAIPRHVWRGDIR